MYNDSMNGELKKDLNKKDPEFYVRMVLSSFEAAVIRALRRYEWGELQIIIQHGQPRKGWYKDSIIFTETDGAAANAESKILESKLKHPIIDEEDEEKKQEDN